MLGVQLPQSSLNEFSPLRKSFLHRGDEVYGIRDQLWMFQHQIQNQSADEYDEMVRPAQATPTLTFLFPYRKEEAETYTSSRGFGKG
jgi:hypothetical protein